jgi:hypothetical protein
MRKLYILGSEDGLRCLKSVQNTASAELCDGFFSFRKCGSQYEKRFLHKGPPKNHVNERDVLIKRRGTLNLPVGPFKYRSFENVIEL